MFVGTPNEKSRRMTRLFSYNYDKVLLLLQSRILLNSRNFNALI